MGNARRLTATPLFMPISAIKMAFFPLVPYARFPLDMAERMRTPLPAPLLPGGGRQGPPASFNRRGFIVLLLHYIPCKPPPALYPPCPKVPQYLPHIFYKITIMQSNIYHELLDFCHPADRICIIMQWEVSQ